MPSLFDIAIDRPSARTHQFWRQSVGRAEQTQRQPTTKTELDQPYAELFDLMRRAIKAGFDLEASWIAYTIVENRIDSTLRNTGGMVDPRGKPLHGLEAKVKAIRKRLLSDTVLQNAITSQGLDLDVLDRWRKQRSGLVHAMADNSVVLQLKRAKDG